MRLRFPSRNRVSDKRASFLRRDVAILHVDSREAFWEHNSTGKLERVEDRMSAQKDIYGARLKYNLMLVYPTANMDNVHAIYQLC